MSPSGSKTQVVVDGRTITVSNLDKVLFPETGFTKGQVIDYYARIAPVLLPHLEGRPITLKRYPDGVDGEFFYEKNSPRHRPDWVTTARMWSRSAKRWIHFTIADSPATLVWMANLASIEVHPSLSTADAPDRPLSVVFDLDPGPPATIVECCRVALALRDLFDRLGLELVAKTSGSKGMQLYAPLNTDVTYDRTKPFALAVAQYLERELPDLVVSNMAKELRGGKVLVDWSQNDEHKTTVAVYSLRARSRPTVSTPVTWDEVAACAEAGDPDLLVFEAGETLARVERDGDGFRCLLELEQELPPLKV